jgi:hypothetical protein
MPVYAAFNSRVARIDVESRAQVRTTTSLARVCALVARHAADTHVIPFSGAETAALGDGQAREPGYAQGENVQQQLLWPLHPGVSHEPQVSCTPSDGLSAHLAYGQSQSMNFTVFPAHQLISFGPR